MAKLLGHDLCWERDRPCILDKGHTARLCRASDGHEFNGFPTQGTIDNARRNAWEAGGGSPPLCVDVRDGGDTRDL